MPPRIQIFPAIAALRVPLLPETLNDSSRRILRTVGLYRAACAMILVGTALVLDLRSINVEAPNAFMAAVSFYLVFSLLALVWVRRDPLPVPLTVTVSSLIGGDIFFIGLSPSIARWGAFWPGRRVLKQISIKPTGNRVVSYGEWFKLIVTAFLVSCGLTAVAFALGWLAR